MSNSLHTNHRWLCKGLLLACLLFLAQAPQARTVRDFFASEPGDVFMLIQSNMRLDLMDYYDSGQRVFATNNLGNGTQLDTITDVYMKLHTSAARTVQLRMVPMMRDTVLAVIETVLTPVPDSHITFYNKNWVPLRSIKPFEMPTLADFFLPATPRERRDDLTRTLPFAPIKLDFAGENFGELRASHGLNRFLSREEFAQWQPHLVSELRYRLQGRKFKLQKSPN
ncbi:MAG: DUF3256 family protein [Muribaculaceae bacterium]|nr:DUF3256 family protein [Muribaculaceae bacterium]